MPPRPSIVLLSTGLLATFGLTACGRVDESEKPDGSRPPVRLQISAAITDRGVDISPSTVGGGPVRIVISNQSDESVKATLERSDGGSARSTRHAIAPGGVAAIQGTVTPGRWRLEVGAGLDPARLRVTRMRNSADDELLLP